MYMLLSQKYRLWTCCIKCEDQATMFAFYRIYEQKHLYWLESIFPLDKKFQDIRYNIKRAANLWPFFDT